MDVTMQEQVDALAHVLNQSVLIEDRDQFPIWWSTRGEVDEVREKTILYRTVDSPTAGVVEQFNIKSAKKPVRTPHINELGMWPRWCMPITKDDEVLGYLWILDPNETIGEKQFPEIISCANAAVEPLANLSDDVRRARLTRRAIEAGAKLSEPKWEALGAWRFIVEAPSTLFPDQIHHGASLLLHEDHEDLLQTARTFLDLGGDVPLIAQELFVHRTTLYYRLDRIQEITGVDLRKDPERIHLQMALWLAAFRQLS